LSASSRVVIVLFDVLRCAWRLSVLQDIDHHIAVGPTVLSSIHVVACGSLGPVGTLVLVAVAVGHDLHLVVGVQLFDLHRPPVVLGCSRGSECAALLDVDVDVVQVGALPLRGVGCVLPLVGRLVPRRIPGVPGLALRFLVVGGVYLRLVVRLILRGGLDARVHGVALEVHVVVGSFALEVRQLLVHSLVERVLLLLVPLLAAGFVAGLQIRILHDTV